MLNGTVFSIEEFSVFDGDGIRMTVFLKGCPLRCEWCHNPEGQRREREVCRSMNGCIECGACLTYGELGESSITACPRGLVRYVGDVYTVEDIVRIVSANADILNVSGGGVTFSGGEPLMQSAFLRGCLCELRGVTDRAIQTAGYCEKDTFLQVLSDCDRVLYDLKLIDDADHIRYTGVSNRMILENYRALSKSGKPFVTRIPLIPTVTDTEKNIEGIADLMKECGVSYVELMPYNKMAGSKYASLARKYEVSFEEHIEPCAHVEIFKEYGIEVKIL
ncbi:MAG: radical SAM protein [Ruminococcaceae bacterium]|nr:radical SAM protein [Oscillospiraceae bacterium]